MVVFVLNFKLKLAFFILTSATASTIAGPVKSPFTPRYVLPSVTDLFDPVTNQPRQDSRFIVGNPGSVGTFGNTTQLNRFSGVGGLLMDTSEGRASCTGQLIAANLVLTAAHCLELSGLRSITFTQPSNGASGPVQSAYAVSYQIHPDYNRPGANNGRPESVAGGSDIALVQLVAGVQGDIYEVYRGNNERFNDHIKVGEGTSGWGLVGNDSLPGALNSASTVFYDGIKRAGFNQYEAYGADFVDAANADPLTAISQVPGLLALGGPSDGILLYDFDNGDARNDAFGNLDAFTADLSGRFFRQQTGVIIDGQVWEVNASPGDSGGASFVLDTDGIWRIGGIGSFGVSFSYLDGVCGGYDQETGVYLGDVSPVTGRPPVDTSSEVNTGCFGNDASFGSITGDTRVSRFASWIDAGLAANAQGNSAFFNTLVPEPGSALLLAFGLLSLKTARRRKSS
jgi:Trypsin